MKISRRSLMKGAMCAAALPLPSGVTTAQYRENQETNPKIETTIEKALRNGKFTRAYEIAAEYELPFSLSVIAVDPTESEDGGTVPGSQRSIRTKPQTTSEPSPQDIYNPPGGPDASYMGLGGYCVRGGNAIGITLSWGFDVRPIDEWQGALSAPEDGVSITYNPSELQMVPNSAKGFEFSYGKDTKPEGVIFKVNDRKQMEERSSSHVTGSISIEVQHNGPESPAPVAYADYVHTWKQARDIITQFNFKIGIGMLDVTGLRVPRNWTAQDEISVYSCT